MKTRTRYTIAAIAGALILLPFVAVLSVFYSQFGLQQVIARLPGLERHGIHIEGVSGTLAGPLRVAKFELFNSRVHILAHDIVIQLRVHQLFMQNISARSIKIGDALVELKEDRSPPSLQPPHFLPSFLRIEASELEIGPSRYVHADGTAVMANHVLAIGSLTSSNLRIDSANIDAPDFTVTGGLHVRATRPLGLTIEGSGELRRDQMTYALSADVDGTLDRLTIRSNLIKPAVASVDAVYTHKQGRWQIDGKVRSDEFDLRAWLTRPPFRLQKAALDVHANADEVRANGEVLVPEVDSEPLSIDAHGRFAAHVLTIRSAEVGVKDTSARLHAAGTVTLGDGAPLIRATANWQALRWPLRGSAIVESPTGSLQFSGRSPYEYSLNAAVAGPKIPASKGTAHGVVTKESLTVASYELTTLGGMVNGAATLEFAQPRAWTLSANGTQLDPSSMYAPLGGQLNVILQARGTGIDTKANFNLNVERLEGRLRNQHVLARGGLDRDTKGWKARTVSVDWGATHATLDGEMRDDIRGRWTLNSTALEQLVPGVTGKVHLNGSASGTHDTPKVATTLSAQGLSYAGWSVAQLHLNANVDVSDKTASDVAIQVQRLERAGLLIEALSLDGKGTSAAHRLDLKMAQVTVSGETAIATADIWFDGEYRNQRWTSTFDTEAAPIVSATGILSSSGYLAMTHPAHAVVASDEFSVDQLCLVVGDGSMCAHADWRRAGPYSAWVSAAQVPLAALDTNPRDQVKYDGRLEGKVEIRGNADAPAVGEARIAVNDAAIIYPLSQGKTDTLELGSGRFEATADAAKIVALLDLKALSQTTVRADGRLTRQNGIAFTRYPLQASLHGKTADANMLPLLFPDIDRAAGTLTADLNASGTLAEPQLDGTISLEHGELDSYRVNLALRELDLQARLANNTIDFKGAGRAGDGTFDANGQLTWRNRIPVGQIHFAGQNLLVADRADYRVVASPDIDFKIDAQQLLVTGTVLIPTARLQPADLSNAVRVSPDAHYTDESAEERAGKLVVDSQVKIVLGDDVRVDSFGLQGQLRGNVGTTVKTGQVAIGRGELSIGEGRYEAYGQKLEITRGRLLFDASPLDDPGLDIQAERKIEQIDVGLNVRGTLRDPRLSFFSDPAMPQMQIVSYLITGKPIDDLQGSDATAVNSARNSLALSGGGFLASQLGRRIGLEEVGVETDANARSSLVLGKFLSPRVFVSYGISLTESINTLKLRYTLSDKWTIKTEAGEVNSADVEYTIER